MSNSCIPSFHKLSVQERVRKVRDRGLLSSQDYKALVNGENVLDVSDADTMIENVIGVMGLPIGLGLNFLINGKDYVVPLAVEEPSIVAALSFAAKTARSAGGFTTSSTEPILIGQIQLVDVPHPSKARQLLGQRKDEVLNLAKSDQSLISTIPGRITPTFRRSRVHAQRRRGRGRAHRDRRLPGKLC